MNDQLHDAELITVETGTIGLITKSEIDQQIATAHHYPRSVKRFRDETIAMVTLSEKIAQECIYALPRDGKTIEGPSARFAEVIASAWGNCRVGARVVNEGAEFITAQGVFHDLERNVAITYEQQRRITNKSGKRFSADMVAVTANAACSIALRNAILKGIPKAFWSEMYTAARKCAAGDVKTLANRRAEAIAAFQIYGVSQEQILALLGKQGVQDISVDDLVTMHGVLTAIKEGDTTPEQAFAGAEAPITQPARKKKPETQGTDAEIVEPSQTQETADPETGEITAPKITDGQRITIEKKLAAAGYTEEMFIDRYGCVPADLLLENFRDVMAWTIAGITSK